MDRKVTVTASTKAAPQGAFFVAEKPVDTTASVSYTYFTLKQAHRLHMEFILALIGPAVVAFGAKKYYGKEISPVETFAQVAIGIGFGFAASVLFAMGQLHDNEVITGNIVNKKRIEDSYEESYDCNCRTVTSGTGSSKTTSTVCDTCWRTIYTVDWYLNTTIGRIDIAAKESEWRSVYNSPNPRAYIDAQTGEACSQYRSYQNYILAAPDSLFNSSEFRDTSYDASIPGYPRMYGIYKMKHALSVDNAFKDRDLWNNAIRDHLKVRNVNSEPNVLFVFTKNTDRTYRYALERKWLGGKKNDLIVVVGTSEYPKVDWVEVITLGNTSGNELTAVKIRDELEAAELDPETTVAKTFKLIDRHFDMKPIEDFEYLTDEQQITFWQAILIIVVSIIVSLIVSHLFSRNTLRSN
ncbi:MAG: hypothetical protein CMP47_12430 [Rickettsiales bacterium]|nr:hypothetical protein [Rickettsiales bacterium]